MQQLAFPKRINPHLTQNLPAMLERMVKMKKGLVRQNGMVLGVCGGLAARFGLSPFIVRLVFCCLMIPGGLPGLVPYLVLAFLMPKA